MKKLLALLLALAMMLGAMAGCSSESAPSDTGTDTTGTTDQPADTSGETDTTDTSTDTADEIPNTFNYEAVENTTGEEIRIAVLTTQTNAFWVDVGQGTEDVKAFLAQPKYNCTVDVQTFDNFDGQAVSEAIETCITMEYDAICTVGVADSIANSISNAVAAGIPVYLFNSNTGVENEATAFVGQDLYGAGEKLGGILADMVGEGGKVGIITGLYSVNAHELRRTGAEKALTDAGVEIVGTAENHDSSDEAYSLTKDFITANPDLNGILVTAGGPEGAARAIEEAGLQDQISLVCFDTTAEMLPYIRSGVIKCTLGQDPYGQGSDPVILAYNEVVTGEATVTGDAFTEMTEYTPDNINEYFPE